MQTIISWAIIFVLGSAAYWYYGSNQNRRKRGRTLTRTADTLKVKDESARQRGDIDGGSKTAIKAPKAKASRKPVKKAVQEVGDKFEAPLSATSSTAGADADDDLSPAVSPALGATTFKAPIGRDVSDMLEPEGSAPTVLRLAPSNQPARAKKQQKEPAAPQETKKQRQNKKKAEEAKAQREADEKERQILLEKQRRLAREARGEPAKNGLQPAKAPTTSAWSPVGSKAGSKPSAISAHGTQLLDTFEPDLVSTSTVSSSENHTNGAPATTESLSNSMQWANLPSEEEQLRMAMEDSEWTTVPKGKKGRKTKATGGDTASEQGSESNVPQSPAKLTPIQPVKSSQSQSRYDALNDATVIPAPPVSHPLDSDWPVV